MYTKSTVDAIFALRQLIQKFTELGKESLYLRFREILQPFSHRSDLAETKKERCDKNISESDIGDTQGS